MKTVFSTILKTLIFIFCLAFFLGFGVALALFVHGEPELALLLIKIGLISFFIYGLFCRIYKRQKRREINKQEGNKE